MLCVLHTQVSGFPSLGGCSYPNSSILSSPNLRCPAVTCFLSFHSSDSEASGLGIPSLDSWGKEVTDEKMATHIPKLHLYREMRVNRKELCLVSLPAVRAVGEHQARLMAREKGRLCGRRARSPVSLPRLRLPSLLGCLCALPHFVSHSGNSTSEAFL